MAVLPWLTEVGRDSLEFAFHGTDSDGVPFTSAHRETWLVQGRSELRLARAPSGADNDLVHGEPRPNDELLLIPPWPLSQLLLRPLLEGVRGGAGLRRPPRAMVFDPAWGAGVDVEGVARCPVVFSTGGRCLSVVRDRRTAMRSGTARTGHGGAAGPHVRDLVITEEDRRCTDSSVDADVVQSVAVLSDAGPRAGAVVAVRSGAHGPNGRLVMIGDPVELLDEGQWWGPFQRGAGSWVSRWLLVPDEVLRTLK